jgi:hypothetical protein
MDGNVPAPQGLPGPQGPAGPAGAAGATGPAGAAGSDASVTAGDGIAVSAGEVSLDTAFTDGLYWKQGGNANADPATQFLGTTDAQPMELRVDNQRAARFQRVVDGAFDAINVISGSPANAVQGATSYCATIAGGGYIMGAEMHGNVVTAKGGTIGGGWDNEAGELGVIGGGELNVAEYYGTVSGGLSNAAGGNFAAIGGGWDNEASGVQSVVAGGVGNLASGNQSMVPGGFDNQATAAYCLAAGYRTRANHSGSFVWGDLGRGNVSTPSYGPNQFFVATAGGIRLTRANSLSGLSTTTSNAAVMVEKLDGGGEALWIRQRLPEDTIPVIKMHRAPSGDNDFVQGLDWSPPNNPVQKFHINKNGTFVAGSDFAEAMPAAGNVRDFEPGDVLVLSPDRPGAVARSSRPADSRVAGVYSTRPGLLGADKDGDTRVDAGDIPVAIVGIVPTKACDENGPIRPGDLLVTSSTAGCAMKARPVMVDGVAIYPTGAIIGKAMEPLDEGSAKIRVLVSLK